MRPLRAVVGAQICAGLAACAMAAPVAAAPPSLDARAWALIDARTGERLAGRGVDRRLAVASATKLMTARLALAELPLGRRVAAAPYDAAPVESKIGLRRGERMTVEDLLEALILESANDAAVTLATAVSGSVGAFVARMNAEAAELGLEGTRFRNPIGLDAPGQHSTAADLARLTRVLMRNATFRRIAGSERATLRSGDRVRRLVTRNDLLLAHPPLTGVKTGHTRRAGYVLVGSLSRGDVRLISVVLGARSERARDSESLRLLRYGLSRYRRTSPVRAGQVVSAVDVRFEDDDLSLRARRGVSFDVRRGVRVSRRLDVPERVEGPITRGRRLGAVRYVAGGRVLGEAPLVAADPVSEPGMLDRVDEALPVPTAVALMLVGVILIAAVVGRAERARMRRTRRRRAMRVRRRESGT